MVDQTSGTLSAKLLLAQALEELQDFEVSHDRDKVNDAIKDARHSADEFPGDDEERAGPLTILAVALQRRYQTEENGDVADVDEAVRITRNALELKIKGSHREDIQVYFHNLERGIMFRYKETKEPACIEDAIKMLDEIVALTRQGGPDHVFSLKVICNICSFAYDQTHEDKFLERGIEAAENAISITPEQHPLRATLLGNLSDFYSDRFQKSKSVDDLDGLIRTSQELLQLRPGGPKDHRLLLLYNAAVSFNNRYDITNDPTDLKKAIDYSQDAVKLAPQDKSEELSLLHRDVLIYRLRQRLRTYLERTNDFPLLEETVLDSIGILNLAPDEQAEPVEWLRSLGDAFQRLYEKNSRVVDLEFAILLATRAMQSTNDQHKDWETLEDDYRARFRMWSDHTGKVPDSEIAIMGFGGSDGGSWLPPELKGDLGLTVPYMIFSGDLSSESQ